MNSTVCRIGLMMGTAQLILHSKRSDRRTPTNRSSRSIMESLFGITSAVLKERLLAKEGIELWSAQNPSYTEG